MDPVKLMRNEQVDVRAALRSDDPSAVSRLARYLDLEERVLFDFYARHVDDDDELGQARTAQAGLRQRLDAEASRPETLNAFDDHVQHVNAELLARLVTRVDAAQYEDLGDALEEARQSWDEHEQPPHVRVGRAAESAAAGGVGRRADRQGEEGEGGGASDSPGAYLGDEMLPATPEPNEPA